MKNKQTILYTLLGVMFGVVIGMMTISSANAVDHKPASITETQKGCHDEEKECDCTESCDAGENCECEKCNHDTKASCGETTQTCGL